MNQGWCVGGWCVIRGWEICLRTQIDPLTSSCSSMIMSNVCSCSSWPPVFPRSFRLLHLGTFTVQTYHPSIVSDIVAFHFLEVESSGNGRGKKHPARLVYVVEVQYPTPQPQPTTAQMFLLNPSSVSHNATKLVAPSLRTHTQQAQYSVIRWTQYHNVVEYSGTHSTCKRVSTFGALEGYCVSTPNLTAAQSTPVRFVMALHEKFVRLSHCRGHRDH